MTQMPASQPVASAATAAPLQMSDLYQRLAKIGLPKKYLKDHILPDWWTDEVDHTPGALLEGALYLSSRLKIDITSLLTSETPQFVPTAIAKFKTQNKIDLQKAIIPYALALCLSEMVACAYPHAFKSEALTSVANIRLQILEKSPVIDLEGVLNFCWDSGIPVIYLNQFPFGVHRFQGMVAHTQSRPVIVVSLNDCSPARLLFVIAHELGHILANHLDENGCRVDTDIQLESDQAEENEANQIAAELLLGQPGISYDIWTKYLSADKLINNAYKYGKTSHTDPGVIALNIVWNRAQRAITKKAKGIAWATGKKALATLEPNANAPLQINQKLAQRISLLSPSDSLKESDRKDYLQRMLGFHTHDDS